MSTGSCLSDGSGSPNIWMLLSFTYLYISSPNSLLISSTLAVVPNCFLIIPIGTIPGRNPGTLAFLR